MLFRGFAGSFRRMIIHTHQKCTCTDVSLHIFVLPPPHLYCIKNNYIHVISKIKQRFTRFQNSLHARGGGGGCNMYNVLYQACIQVHIITQLIGFSGPDRVLYLSPHNHCPDASDRGPLYYFRWHHITSSASRSRIAQTADHMKADSFTNLSLVVNLVCT